MPSQIIESIIHKAAEIQNTIKDPNEYMHHLEMYAQVCTTWRDVILSSRAIKNQCKDLTISTSKIKDRRLIQSGFLSIVGRIHLGVERTWARGFFEQLIKTDYVRFVQKCISNNVTAINTFTIQIYDETDVEGLADILKMSPKASTFTLDFTWSTMSTQKQAKLFWKLLQTVFYCNAEEKVVNISSYGRYDIRPVNWSFTKKAKFQPCQIGQEPGTVKLLDFSYCRFGQAAPDLKCFSVPIERIGFELESDNCDHGFFTNTMTKCLQLRVESGPIERRMRNLRSSRLLEMFSKYDKIEVHFEELYDEDMESCCLVLSTIRHPNLHAVLVNPFRVGDVFQFDEEYYCDECYDDYPWVKADLESFVFSLQNSTAKTVTYPLPGQSKNATFNCDENFESTFKAFLDTQPIYIGRDDQSFTTLQMAKQSFDNGCKCYCTKHCRCL